MEWIQISINWYLMLFFLGVIFFPITKKIFGRFFLDFGYPFAKTLSILLLSYVIFVLSILKLVPFTQIGLLILVLIFTFLNFVLLIRDKPRNKSKKQWFIVFFEEIIFLSAFLFWTYVRGQEPSIRGLEKFMDFGFINSILRAKFFPPLDMWLSGYPINYYYFGHLTGATLIKLINIKPAIGYNLILSTIFALSVTQSFSLVVNLIYNYWVGIKNFVFDSYHLIKAIFFGLLGAFIVNLGGNLHTIYLFTSGYSPDNPIPFWKILSFYNPGRYWYPNATRFIPFTIHEFPSYSYVVADLHGHVFDIPFVLLTLAVLLLLFMKNHLKNHNSHSKTQNSNVNPSTSLRMTLSFAERVKCQNKAISISTLKSLITNYYLLITIFLGFLLAVHYMTNAFDGPIYFLLTSAVLLTLSGLTLSLIVHIGILVVSFIIFSLPFSINFSPFVTGIGVNCGSGLVKTINKLGPFLFEKDNCQVSPVWMLFVLWGFFWLSFILFLIVNYFKSNPNKKNSAPQSVVSTFVFILFCFGSFLLIIPEFFYIKDIYPAHFRANTMFKLGYQAFIMMGIAAAFTFFVIGSLSGIKKILLKSIFIFGLFFIFIYPFYATTSYYGNLNRPVILDGASWLASTYAEDKEIIDFLNENVESQPVILEAQGDSYTDFERISAYTGLPTVAGWWVHEWLWRGSADIVGKKIPDVINLYESRDLALTKNLIEKYKIQYIIVSKMEKQKYSRLFEEKFSQIGRLVFKTSNGSGAIYQVNFK